MTANYQTLNGSYNANTCANDTYFMRKRQPLTARQIAEMISRDELYSSLVKKDISEIQKQYDEINPKTIMEKIHLFFNEEHQRDLTVIEAVLKEKQKTRKVTSIDDKF